MRIRLNLPVVDVNEGFAHIGGFTGIYYAKSDLVHSDTILMITILGFGFTLYF